MRQSRRGDRCGRNSKLGYRGSGWGKAGVKVDAAETRSLVFVEVDATNPAWRSMRAIMLPKFELGYRGSGCGKAGVDVDAAGTRSLDSRTSDSVEANELGFRGSGCDKGGVKFLRTSNFRGP